MKTCVLFPKAFSYNYMNRSVIPSMDVPSSYELHLNPHELTIPSGLKRSFRRKPSLTSTGNQVYKEAKPRLLHVEDSAQIRLLVSIFLKNNFEIDSVNIGETAVKKAKKNQYDIVLVDIDLGNGINGFDVSRYIREIKGYEKTPIIALTSNDYHHVRDECLTSRINAYIQKPFDKQYLLGTIQELNKHI